MQDQEILEKLKDKRTRCIVYSRVMGYHRPVESFNIGKKGEHKERVMFVENHCRCHKDCWKKQPALPRQQGEKSNQKKGFQE